MKLSANAITVLERRYVARDEAGRPMETCEQLFDRVARAIAAADARFDPQADTDALAARFLARMTDLQFMPNSPTLMNAGRPMGQLSACFVLPVPDSMEGIFDAVKNAALIHKSGGGTGFSFSRLRASGSSVRSTGGVASGPVSFMKVFNAATEAIKQGGTRRGANMGILRADHPDVEAFIRCKQSDKEITNFNISIGLTESFMRAVQRDESYDMIDPRTKAVVATKRARAVFDLIVDSAYNSGEPGIVFLDRLNRDNVVPSLGEIEATNPCGEQPLLPYESCNLGSVNLATVVRGGKRPRVEWELLGSIVDDAVHFLDNVIDVNKYPLPEIEEMTKQTRKIGLGVMGFADMLFQLGVAYDSEEGVALADKVMSYIHARARRKSAELAKTRGAFPAFEQSTMAGGEPMRNATVTTIAPTGTISILCGVSSGIEPLFALAFVRNVMDNDALPEANPYFEAAVREAGAYTPELMRQVAQEGTLAHMTQVPEALRRVFVTAHDISPEAHIRMQAAFQRHTDNAVSKTVNFRNEATRQDVERVYLLAAELGCKGVTIYRDGSRSEQVLTAGAGKKTEAAPAPAAPVQACVQAESDAQHIMPRARPEVTQGYTEKVRIGCGNLYVTVNYDAQGICEVFTNLGRAGGCPSQSEATSRLASMALRAGMDVGTVVEQLRGIRCLATLRQRDKNIKVLSCPDAIGRVLARVEALKDGTFQPVAEASADEAEDHPDAPDNGCSSNCSLCTMKESCNNPHTSAREEVSDPCPECGAPAQHDSGCIVCRSCGYSKCG